MNYLVQLFLDRGPSRTLVLGQTFKMDFLKSNKLKQINKVKQVQISSIYEPEKCEKEKEASKDDDIVSANDVIASKNDVLTSIVGEFGRFQLFNLFMMGISTIMVGTNNFVTKFLAHEVDYWCEKVKKI